MNARQTLHGNRVVRLSETQNHGEHQARDMKSFALPSSATQFHICKDFLMAAAPHAQHGTAFVECALVFLRCCVDLSTLALVSIASL